MSKDSEKGKYTTPDGTATWEYVSAACCALLVFCSGCAPSWIAPALGILLRPESPIRTTAEDGGDIASMVAIGYMLAPIITILVIDRFGRRNSLIIGSIPLIVSWGLTVVAKDVTVLIVARFLGGMSMGLTVCVVPIYLGEIASVKLRGALGMICNSMINTGTVFMFTIVPQASIQMTASICMGIITIAAVITWFIPESPYFLAMRGRLEEAEISLEKLRGKTDVTEELNLIKATLEQDKKVTDGDGKREERTTNVFKLLFTVPSNRKSLCINVFFSIALAWGGAAVISTYCPIIFGALEAPISPNSSMIITGLLQLSSNILTTFVVGRFGRRPLLLISGTVGGTSLLIVAVYLYLLENTEIDVAPYSIYALCALFANLIAVNMGLMPLQMVIQSETIATDMKACTISFVSVMGGFLTGVSLKAYIFLAVTLKFGHAVPFFVFTITMLVCTFTILKLLPETRGKTFLEIQNSLRK